MSEATEMTGCAIGGNWRETKGKSLIARSPIDGATLATFRSAQAEDVSAAVAAAGEAFLKWRVVPAPRRGELVRQLGLP